MAISRVGNASTTAGDVTPTTSSGAVTLPSGLAAGDLLIIAVHRQLDYPLTSSTPTGYTLLRNILDVGTTPNAAQTDIFYKIASGSEGTSGPTFTTGTAARWIVHTGAYRGVNTTTPFIVENGQAKAAGSTANDAPAITNNDADAWGVYIGMGRGVATPVSWSPPTGMVERLDTDLAVANTSNGYAEWSDTAGPVATGAVTYTATLSSATGTATAWAAFLKPITSGPPVPTGLTATPVSSTQIDLSWNPSTGATGYDVERDGSVVAAGVAATSYSDAGLAPSTSYSYRVRSVG